MYERTGDPMYPVWYTRAPLGKNTLSNLMTSISKLANRSMNYTNHSIRATSITEMDEAAVASRRIMRISGHKSEASIKNYSNRLSDKKRGKYLTV
jgi:integrase